MLNQIIGLQQISSKFISNTKVMGKIPSDASRVFAGVLFDVYQKETEQFDGSSKTFERVRGFDIVKAICVVGDKIVILHEQQPGGIERTTLPGGMIDRGEDPLEAIKREILEETGYVFESVKPLFVLPSNVGLFESYRHVFLATGVLSQQEANVDSGGEKILITEMSFDDCLKNIVADPMFLPGVGDRVVRNYLLPQKKEELRALLFG